MLLHKDITDTIIRAFFTVYNTLGYGFLEKVYEKALAHELHKLGLRVTLQVPIKVYYDGLPVGDYIADMIVQDSVIVEIKAADCISPQHTAQ